jgi:hypothetical protein
MLASDIDPATGTPCRFSPLMMSPVRSLDVVAARKCAGSERRLDTAWTEDQAFNPALATVWPVCRLSHGDFKTKLRSKLLNTRRNFVKPDEFEKFSSRAMNVTLETRAGWSLS